MPISMNEIKRFISFDLGAESGRCVVATFREGKLTLDEVHRFVTHNVRSETGFFWDVLAIREEIVEGLSRAQRAFGSAFDGIGIDTWGVDYVLLDSEDRILGYPYHYRDNRTDGMMEEAFKVVPREKMYGRTGTQSAQFNTVFQLLAESKRDLNLLTVADKMLLMPDYLNFTLSGRKRSEFTIASTTGLVDPKTRNWDWELIREFGFPERLFPEMAEPGTRLGTLSHSLAKRTGLDPGIPVIAGAGHDTASAVVSAPAADGGWAFLSSGTWSLMGVELRKPILSRDAMKFNFTNEGGVDGTTRFLKNIIGLWPIQECRRHWAEKGNEYSYAQLTSLASEEGFVKAWVDLNDLRFLKPGEMPDKIRSYLSETGQQFRESVGFIIRVVMESLAFSYRKTIGEIEKVTGGSIEKLYAVGGGIQNELLMQYTADAIGRTVYAGPIEGAIVGNAGVVAVATGAVAGYREWRDVVARSFDQKIYRPANAIYFVENEEKYKAILRQN